MANPDLLEYLSNHSAFKSLLKDLIHEHARLFGGSVDNFGLNPDTLKPQHESPSGGNIIAKGILNVDLASQDNSILGAIVGDLKVDKLNANAFHPRGVFDKSYDKAAISAVSSTATTNTVRPAKMNNVRSGYTELAKVLEEALEQAQNGKGNQRHQVNNASFTQQPICELTRLYGLAYPFGQAAKKAHEVNQLQTTEAKIAELLGAINYLAAAVIVLKEQQDHNI